MHVCMTESLCWTEKWTQHYKSTIPQYGLKERKRLVWDDVRAEATEKDGGGRGTGKALESSSGRKETGRGRGRGADCWAFGSFSGNEVHSAVNRELGPVKTHLGARVVHSRCGVEPRGQRGLQLGRVCMKKGPHTHFKEHIQPPCLTRKEGNTSG